MKVKDAAIRDLAAHFVVNEDSLDEIEEAVLERASGIITDIESISQRLEEIFSEDGATYAIEVSTLFRRLSDAGVDPSKIFPKSGNLHFALAVANAINNVSLDKVARKADLSFRIDEYAAPDGVYSPDGTKLSALTYENIDRFEDSISYLDLTDGAEGLFSADFDGSQKLNVALTILLANTEKKLSGKRWIVSRIASAVKREHFLKYQVLLRGNILVQPVSSPPFAGTGGIETALSRKDAYEQFKEPFDMLSEINSSKTVLEAYLSAYHTLENYMVRAKIVSVETSHTSSKFFSMRQFKRVGVALDDGELKHLLKLIQSSWNLHIGGSTFAAFVDQKISDILAKVGAFNSPILTDFLNKLGATQDFSDRNHKNRQERISALIYQVRCSIVHNKETEYHISNRELRDPTIYDVITILCIPIMHRLAFGLPSVIAANPIRYSRKSIELY